MRLRLLVIVATGVCLSAPPSSLGQGRAADYERSANLQNTVRGKVLNRTVQPRWTSPSSFWYRVDLGGDRVAFWKVDASTGTKLPMFDAEALARRLTGATGLAVDPERLPIDDIEPSETGLLLILRGDPRLWLLSEHGTLREQSITESSNLHLRPLPGPRPSSGGNEPTSIIFVNRTDQPATLSWIDRSGSRRAYGHVGAGQSRWQHTYAGHVWAATDAGGTDLGVFESSSRPGIVLLSKQAPSPPVDPTLNTEPPPSPDRITPRVFVRDHNVWVRDSTTGQDVSLTSDGSPQDGYDGRVFISPDGARAVAIRTRRGGERRVHYVESSPRDQTQPRLRSYAYPKPGDEIPESRPRLFNLSRRSIIPVSDELLPAPWSINRFRWEPDSSRFTFLYVQRGHRVVRVLSIDALTGTMKALVSEEPDTFVDATKTYLHHIEGSRELLWASERSGHNHLYLIDAATGSVKNAVTSGRWVVRSVDRVDEQRRQVHLRVMGIHPKQDPYHIHYARVNFDGSGLTLLTDGDGTHEVQQSPTGEYLIATHSRADLPPITELRRSSDGSLISTLEQADCGPLLATGWKPPQRFTAKGRDGTTDIWGLIHRPSNFDPAKRYPVIESIYAGPHGHHVPKAFSVYSGASAMAELGFIVVQIDGMGTNWRSKAFLDMAWKNLRDAGFPDRIAWLRAAAESHPEMDIENGGRAVGIYGGSAGGQNAMAALLWHGEFYKVAAADCGCHDNRMDKIWWNELWMSWPIGPHYAESSNVVNAHRLRPDGKLFLTVGEMDENVDPASTLQVVDALVRADKDFELLIMPGLGHGAGESPYASRRRQDFFVRHLMGVEPRRGTLGER